MLTAQRGSLNGTALDYLGNIPLTDDYVIFRSDDYITVLAHGDLSVSGNVITGNDVQYIAYNQRVAYGNNWYPAISRGINDVSVDTSSCLFYTNVIDDAPHTEGQSMGLYGMAVLCALGFLALWSVVQPLFSYTLFKKRGC